MLIGPDQIAIGLQPRQFARPRAGGDDDVLAGQLFGALVGFDQDLAFGRNCCRAHDDVDLVLFQQTFDARRELLGHTARAFHHRVQVVADIVGLEAKILGPLHQVEHL